LSGLSPGILSFYDFFSGVVALILLMIIKDLVSGVGFSYAGGNYSNIATHPRHSSGVFFIANF
jgi:hypothetical protein